MRAVELIEGRLKSIIGVNKLKRELVVVAQKEYDRWEQNDDGYDEELGYGGICQNIADAMASVLAGAGYDITIVDSMGVGEQHVWVVLKAKEGVYSVDIPPYVYETGGGFNWKKKHDIEFSPEDIEVYKISADPRDFKNYLELG